MVVAFNSVGSIAGVNNGAPILTNPTTLQFGPDGRLYVTEQDGTIDIFTVGVQAGEYVATGVQVVNLVKSIQNHNDDGSNFSAAPQARQLTGILVTGTAANPVIYATSSDPRIATEQDKNLDTNSGVLTRLTWTGSTWQAVDLIRGLPRSEENHAPNGMVLSPDGQTLYLTVGGNTNNGAPSSFFANTAEYALSASVLAVDLAALAALPVKTDTTPGLNNGRKYVYDLPTLDDPNTPNNGARENAAGMDVAGPWGGRDGLNQAILPSDAPISVHATGFRNAYDLVMTADGRLYTVDNGSNSNLGGNPVVVNGEATNQINNGGTPSGEPLFLVEQGGYYGHPNPTRANQNQSWTVRDDAGNPDASLAVNTVADISALVPNGVSIPDGFLIAPGKFTSSQARLTEEGVRVPHPSAGSEALVVIGSSSNGLVEYTADNFEGELQGDLLVAQFNGNVARLNLGPDGTTATYETIPGLSGLATPLDVTVGPDGTLWIAEIAGGKVGVFAPSDIIVPGDPDTDDDGLANAIDPFIRDASNGGQAFVLPSKSLVWDFDANLDGNRPGAGGYGGGLTGVMIDGTTDFDSFFNEPAEFPLQNIKLDNVKFTTAAGGGTTVIENVSTGSASGAANSGEYLFHTGATVAPTVERFTVQLTTINPFGELGPSSGPSQQIGAYIGTGDQKNFLKLVVLDAGAAGGQIQFSLENGDSVLTSATIPAPGILDVPLNEQIVFEVLIDRAAGTAMPKVTYGLGGGASNSLTGAPISIAGSNVEKAIDGDWSVMGQTTGLALGLYASNVGQSNANSFQAIFTDLKVLGEGDTDGTPIWRVNAGGPTVAATDGGPAWTANTAAAPGPHMASPGNNNTNSSGTNVGDESLPSHVPTAVIKTERFDNLAQPEMSYAFDVPEPGIYEVRLFVGSHFLAIADVGDTVFDVRAEGVIASAFDNIDPVARFGHRQVGMISSVVEVRDGELDLEFLHDVAGNPTVNGIEILQLATFEQPVASLSIQPPSPATIQELANDGETMLVFPVAFDRAPVSPVTVTYQVTVNGVVTVANGVLDLGFDDGFISVAVPNDGVNNGSENVVVTLTGITAGDNGTDLGQVSASGTITEDDAATPPDGEAIYRVNVGGGQVAATDGGIAWSADTAGGPSPHLVSVGPGGTIFTTSSSSAYKPVNGSHPSIPPGTPLALFDNERYDPSGAPNMAWAFPVEDGTYTVNLYFAELYVGIDAAGERVQDVAVEGAVPAAFDNVDAFAVAGPAGGFVRSATVTVTDGVLNLDFLRGTQNPDVSAIEIIAGDGPANNPPVIVAIADIAVDEGATASFAVNASDLDDDPVGLGVSVVRDSDGAVVAPTDYAFVDNGDGTASFQWLTDDADAGVYTATVTADDGTATDTETLTITVDDVPPSGTNTLTVRAGGTGTPSLPPQFEVIVDGVSLGIRSITDPVAGSFNRHDDALYQNYTFSFAGPSPETVQIRYLNDGSGGGVARDLYVDYIDLNGTVFESEVDGFFTPNNPSSPVRGPRESLFVNGTLSFDDLPPTGGGTNAPPVIAAIADVTVEEGATASFAVNASDPDGEVPGLGVTVVRDSDGTVVSPGEYTFADNGDGTASFTWLTDGADAGSYTATVTADDGMATDTETVSITVDDVPAGGHTLVVRAGGTGTASQPPQFEVIVDGVSLGVRSIANPLPGPFNVNNDANYQDYSFSFAGPAPRTVQIRYLNDGSSGGVARDLFVDYITLNGTTFESEVDGFFTPNNPSSPIRGPRQSLFVNGTLSFDDLPDTGGGDPDDPVAILLAQADLETGANYAPGVTGSAVLRVMDGIDNIRASNFAPGSFQVENTGGKKISGVFIDVRGALYGDSVFDPDGAGGDSVHKPWTVDSTGGTGGFVDGSGYFLPGPSPLPNTTGTGQPSNGGFRGAMVKFNAAVAAGFQTGEVVTFSGDMDPNSVAGLLKSGVDAGAVQAWDVGGVSGHELIGSEFVVLFDDGTTARGQLMSNRNVAGAHAFATQAPANETVGLTVNGVGPGGSGTWGGTLPSVIVTADPGETVRITMTKGFNPVTNPANGIAGLVNARLADDAFKANNAFDAQTVDVVVGPNGVFDASHLFDYDDLSDAITNVGAFAGDDVAQIGFVAAAVDPGNGRVPKGSVTDPIYLANAGGPVAHDPPAATGFYAAVTSGSSSRFKVQFEDPNGPGGTTPPGKWDFFSAPDGAGRQTGFQGSGYYVWGPELGTAANGPIASSALSYTIFVPEGQQGNYSLRVRSSRDAAGHNDLWVKIDDNAEALQVNPANTLNNGGYVRLLGGPVNTWGYGQTLDAVSGSNFTAVFELDAGVHTITFAGRTEGYHLDFWELFKGASPGATASNSPFDPGTPPDDFLI